MDSTSTEYYHTLDSLRRELLDFKSEQNKLRYQISSLYDENKKLASELKKNVEIRFQQLSESDVGLLQQKLQAEIASKNAAVQMWQSALKELEKKDELLHGKRNIVAAERTEIEESLNQTKENYTKGLNILSLELSGYREEVNSLKKTVEEKSSDVEKYKSELNASLKKLEDSKRHIEQLSDANNQYEEKIVSLESLLSSIKNNLASCTEELSLLKGEKTKLAVSASELKDTNVKLRTKILMLEKDAKEALITAQEAILLKKEAILKQENSMKEIEVLKSSIDLEIEKVSMRYKAEIKDIQKKASEKTKSLLEEIQFLHTEIGEKQSKFDRANREKQALESKIDQLFSENSSSLPVTSFVFDDLCKRLTAAERARDEYELKVTSLETTLQEMKSSKDIEIQDLERELYDVKEQFRKLSKSLNLVTSDKVKLSDEVTKLKKRASQLEKELNYARTKHSQEVASLEEDSKHKQQVYSEQLRLVESHYKSICSELQKLLDAEFRISNKWKTEVDDIMSKSEIKFQELYQDVANLKKNNSELLNILLQRNIQIPSDVMFNTSFFVNDGILGGTEVS